MPDNLQPRRVIGIAGGTAAGKSTLAAALRDHLQSAGRSVAHFSLDRYFHDDARTPQFILPSTGESLPDRNHPDSADHARLASDIVASTADVTLLDGHFVLALDNLRALMHLKVFVDLDDDTRAVRRMLRDLTNGRGRGDPHYIAEYFLHCAKPGHDRYVEPSRRFADLIVRGDADVVRSAALLAAAFTLA